MLAPGPVLDALGNPTRRRILEILLEGPCPVGAIAARLPISRPAVSKHLRILERAGLASWQAQGNHHLFQLDRSGFDEARAWIEGFWSEALPRFAAVAERSWTETSS